MPELCALLSSSVGVGCKVLKISWVTGSWVRDIVIEIFKFIFWHFEQHKPSAILLHYNQETADIPTAKISNTWQLRPYQSWWMNTTLGKETKCVFFLRILGWPVPLTSPFDMVWLLESIQWYDGEAFASVHNCNSARMIWNHSVSFKSSSSVRILPSLFSAVLYSLVYLQEGQTNKEEFNCEKKKKNTKWTPSSFLMYCMRMAKPSRQAWYWAVPEISIQEVNKPM